MPYTDGLVIRCPNCGALNIMFAGANIHCILKCLNCEGSIMPHDSIIYKQGYDKVLP